MDTYRKSSTAAPLFARGLMTRSKRIFRLLTYVSMVLILFSFGVKQSYGQGVGISEVSITPHSSAILELKSMDPTSYKGLLIPRMTTSNRLSITTDAAAAGLIVYDTDKNLFCLNSKKLDGRRLRRKNRKAGCNSLLIVGQPK